ncbi:MAG TPA: hypothetical protein VMM55_06270 [Thermohalobaculum sp.]|nr:hypothetical protein [Thermohalobaculum sp.]
MTAVPVWATCHDTSSVREPGQSAQVESNADLDVASRSTDGEHLRAEEVPVENLDEHQATQGDEDPAPEGYTTNVPPELIVDDADVGETTPESTEGEADKRNAELSNRAREGGSETKAMKTSVDEAGEYAEESVEEQAAMANTEENAEKVEEMTENTVLGEGGQIEAATGGAEPTENWFGCNSDADGSEGDACEPSETEAAAPSGGVEEERDYAELETEPAKREVNLEVECLEEPGVDGASKG